MKTIIYGLISEYKSMGFVEASERSRTVAERGVAGELGFEPRLTESEFSEPY